LPPVVGLPVVAASTEPLDASLIPHAASELGWPANRWSVPEWPQDEPLYTRETDVRRIPGLAAFAGRRVRREQGLDWIEVTAEEWFEASQATPCLRAPELSDHPYTRALAEAERDLRAALRSREQAAAARASVARGLAAAGRSRAQIARALGVTRERAHQLVVEAPVTSEPAVSFVDLAAAVRAFEAAQQSVGTARATRRSRVLTASEHFGFGLGQIADTIEVSRSQAQQLRDTARRERAER
jgi:hypothetical protein